MDNTWNGVGLSVVQRLFKGRVQPEVFGALDLDVEVRPITHQVGCPALAGVLHGATAVEPDSAECLARFQFAPCPFGS